MVPSRQRAAALRLAFASQACQRALRVWRSPDVLPWQGWLLREFEERRAGLNGARRLLQPTEAWLIWRRIAASLAETHGLLAPGGLATALPRALERQRDWGIEWGGDAGAEAGVLRAAGQAWLEACRDLDAVDAGDWRALPVGAAAATATRTTLTGFASIGTARRAWLAGRGIVPGGGSARSPVPLLVHAAADPAAELRAAAAWCRARLEADPRSRLLVIVPALERQRARLLRIFDEELDPAAAGAAPASFATEGGQPLAAFPLVGAALDLLAFDIRPLPLARFSALLRTPYLDLGPLDARVRLDLWLRERGLDSVDAAELQRLQGLIARTLGSAAAGVVQRLLEGRCAAQASDGAGGWARRFVARMRAAGWPGGGALGSDEQQVRQRFDALLGDFAGADGVLARRGAAAAEELLAGLARDTLYEPASDDVPVTISGYTGDPLVDYDGIWVCGCDSTHLPAAPTPDAFIPLSAQLAAGVPEASAEGQLQLARAAIATWRSATEQLILSWSQADEDVQQTASTLLAGSAPWTGVAGGSRVAVAAPLEASVDERGPPWPRERRIAAGVQALQWQAECPFRAFAQLRLGAGSLPESAAGVDPRLRGRVLHRALEVLWGELRDSAGLHALAPAQQAARVAAAAAAALEHELGSADAELPALLRAGELRRTVLVIGALLDGERERTPFRVLATEARRLLEGGGLALALRLDRVDALDDGSVAILDYKSARPGRFDPHAERLRQAQLPAYALAWEGAVAAVATVHLRRDGVRWCGAADADGRLPQVRAAVQDAAGWTALRDRWREGLEVLLAELAAGTAPVAPLPGACEHCDLAALCRVDAAQFAGTTDGDGAGGGPGDDA